MGGYYLPAAPLVPHLLNAARFLSATMNTTHRVDGHSAGINLLGRAIADKVGGDPESRSRTLYRIVSANNPVPRVHEKTADEICVGIGLLPQEVWGQEWHDIADAIIGNQKRRRQKDRDRKRKRDRRARQAPSPRRAWQAEAPTPQIVLRGEGSAVSGVEVPR